MKKHERILSWAAIIISMAAIGTALYRSYNLEWDAIMFAVAMLSGLVVLLIGWNIYTIWDVKKLEDRVREDLNEIAGRHEEDKRSLIQVQKIQMEQIQHTSNNIYRSQLIMIENKDINNDDFLYVYFSICSIEMLCALGDTNRANTQIALCVKRLPSRTIIDSKSRRDLMNGLEVLKREYDSLEIEELIELIDDWEHENLI